jgi:branched-chain amino acid transport system substrate-binding protein
MLRTTMTWRVAATTMAAGLLLTACGGTTSDEEEASDAAAGGGCAVSLGFFGALTGDYAALGQNIKNGVQLAIDQY